MKLNFIKTINIFTLICLIGVVSCTDDFPYRTDPIPEGDGTLSATVTFTPITASSLGTTRTDGDAIQNIESLCVLVYDTEKKLVKKYTESATKHELKDYSAKKYNEEGAHQITDEDNPDTDEMTTAKATFSLPDLPYGQYYIYAVANMGDKLSDPEYEEIIQSVEGLQNIKLTWDPDDIGKNNQMFGYFTSSDDMESNGFDPKEPITFTNRPKDSKIHAWLKRAASKVTVAFNPSGLNQGVTIYVRNVTVRDIPKTCLLGAENTPTLAAGETADKILWNHLSSYGNPDYKTPTFAVANSRLEYNSEGVITKPGESTGDNTTDGLRLDNSIKSAVPANAHATNEPSLFFYENNQNPYLEKVDPNYKNKKEYDKTPQSDGDDKVGTTIHKPENIEGKDKINDFKDRVPLGTYVEVEAYYISSNPANPGEGTIKYRFMLGKDTSFDYDAERNYHYKLTLGFKGWANEPDWHIDYVITTPSIEVPSVFRVSYLYHQKSELPIKIVGDIEYLTVTITENNWAPYDPDTEEPITLGGKEYKVPSQIVESEPSAYQFQWNREAFVNEAYQNPARKPTEPDEYPYNLPVGEERPQFGFLALHMPTKESGTTTIFEGGHSKENNDKLIAYWNDALEGERRFSSYYDNGQKNDFSYDKAANKGEVHDWSYGDSKSKKGITGDDKYTVNPVLDDNGTAKENQCILMLPLWTRTKSLIEGSGFSGNNPYEAFERKAVVHIVAQFKNTDEDGNKIRIPKDVEVYQVKRITNPKGVWRAHNKTASFNVTLMEPINSNAESDFQPFRSQGEWKAYLDDDSSQGTGFSLRPNSETSGYMENGVIHGNTGSEIHFAINFGNAVRDNESQCAVVKVEYHGNQCMHKILVRKGYNEPLLMGDNKRWSSFALYQATSTGTTEEGRQVFNAVLTKNPLMLGSMFRRGKQDQGIFVWNNVPAYTGLGPFVAPDGKAFVVGKKKTGVTVTPGVTGQTWKDQWEAKDWTAIDFDDVTTAANRENNLGIFYAFDDEGNRTTDANGKPYKYRVPTYQEFKDLTDNSEFGFGVFYGSAATEPKRLASEAYGLIDPYNEGLFEDQEGMRAVVAYDKYTGNQILFPIGRYGIGVRRMYSWTIPGYVYNGTPDSKYFGHLQYSDVWFQLTLGRSMNNLYRPIPYNMPIVSGCIYWIDQFVANIHPTTGGLTDRGCLGWDMNYFNFDFNAYTANNWQDACPIKFVIDE